MTDIVRYISSFEKLIGLELRNNVNNAELIEELEENMKEREREIAEQYESDMEDIIRAEMGLSSLSSFENKVENVLQLSEFGNELNNLSESFSSIGNSVEELASFYEDGVIDLLLNVSTNSLNQLLKKMSLICPDIEENTLEGLFELLEWTRKKSTELLGYRVEGHFECIEYGKMYNVYSFEQEEYILDLDEMYLSPSTGGQDVIDIRLRGKEEDEWLAQVSVSYGEVKFNDDGGVVDASEEGVYLKDCGIVDKLNELLNDWKNFIAQEESIKEGIEEIIYEVESEYEEV